MNAALDNAELPPIPRYSMWRVRPGRPFTGDVERSYGDNVLVRLVKDGTVTFHKRGGQDFEDQLEVDDFLLWYEFCHQEGERCRRCHTSEGSPRKLIRRAGHP